MLHCLGRDHEFLSASTDSYYRFRRVPRFEHFSGAIISFVNHLRIFKVNSVIASPCILATLEPFKMWHTVGFSLYVLFFWC